MGTRVHKESAVKHLVVQSLNVLTLNCVLGVICGELVRVDVCGTIDRWIFLNIGIPCCYCCEVGRHEKGCPFRYDTDFTS